MTRIMCDICGREINSIVSSEDNKKYAYSITVYGTKQDTCMECRKALYNWIEGRKAECKTSATEVEKSNLLNKIKAEVEELQLVGYAAVKGKRREVASKAVMQIIDKYIESEAENADSD